MLTGSCLCRAVSFEITGTLPHPPDACHCSQCRKQSGHFFVSANVQRDALKITGIDNLTWFRSSEHVRRGFCALCGSSLFWDPIGKDFVAIAMGAIDGPSGTLLAKHIFVRNKGDYYDICDGLPQSADW
jgi:hypothetical protein